MRILAALDQMRQITKVARAFNVTQPAISKQIAELERALGTPIIHRQGNSIAFTPAGAVLVRHAKDVLNRIQRTEFDIEALRKGLGGTVRIGVASSLMPTIVPEAIRLMIQAAPSSVVTVSEGHFGNMLPMLYTGDLDLLVMRIWKPFALEGVEQLSLGREPLVVVAGTGHPLARKKDIGWETALEWPWMKAAAGSLAADGMNEFLAEKGLGPMPSQIEAASIVLSLSMMRLMPCLALFPERLARYHSARGELSILSLNTSGYLSESNCFWLSSETDETVTLFRECLVQAARDLFDD
ncbi:MAG: LysR substrate-binding domain-containing protein [Thalassobaculaceae bacterium]|nr:LysR substrate-binding domain-containing protein [Thalassobaculaceae bacterium]